VNENEALQAALAGEHAALYGMGIAGGRLSGARFRAVTTLYGEHRRRRDRLTGLLLAAGQTPAAAEPAYDLPQPVTTAVAASALVLLVQRRLTVVYGDLVEAAERTPVRIFAVQAVISISRAQVEWGAAPAVFPANA
jgi:hypothetical protein